MFRLKPKQLLYFLLVLNFLQETCAQGGTESPPPLGNESPTQQPGNVYESEFTTPTPDEGSGYMFSGDNWVTSGGSGYWFSGDGSGFMPSGDGFPTDITTLPGFWSNGSYTHFEYENGLVEIHGQTNESQFKVTWNNGTHSFYTARDGLHLFNGESNGTHNFYTESDGQQIWYGFDDGHNFMYGGSNRTHIWGGGKNDTHSFMYIGPGEMQGKERDGLEPNWQTNEDGMKHFQANGAHITWFFDEAVNAETRTLWEHIDNMIAHEGSGSPGDNIFYLFSEGKLHDFFLDNDDGMHEGSGFWPPGDGYGPWFSGDGSGFMPSGDGFPTDITTLPGFWSNGSYTHFEYENGLVEIHGQTNGSRFKVTWNNGTHSFYTARDGLHFFNGESNGTHNFYTESDGQQIWYGFDDGHNFMYGGSNRTHIWGGGKNDTHSFMYIGPGEMQGKERDGSEPNWQTNEDGMKHFQANGAHITWFFDEAVNAETRILWEHIDKMIAHEGSGSPGDNIFYLFSEGKLHDFFLDNDDGMHEGSGFWPSGDGYGPWFSDDGSGFMPSGDGFPTDITTLPGFWSNGSYTHFEYENGLVEIHGQTNGSQFKVTWNNVTHSFYTARDGLHFFNGESNGTHNFYTESDGQQIWYGFDDGHNFMYGGSNRTHIWGGGKNDTHSFMYIGPGEMQGKERDGLEPNWQTNEDGMKHFQDNGAHIIWFFNEAVNAETRTLWEHIDNMIAHEGSGSPGDNIFYLFSEGKLHDFFLDNDDGMHEGLGFWPSGDGYGPWFSGDGSSFMPSGDGFPTDITTLPGFWSNGSYTHFDYENGLVEIHGQTNGSRFKVTWNNGTHSFYTARDGLHFFNGESNGTHNFYTESDGQQIWYGFDDGHNFMYGGSNRTHIWGGGKNDTHSFMYIGPGEMQGKERDGSEPNWQTNEDGMKHFQANGAHITWFFDEAVNAETRTLWEHIDNMIAHEGSGSPGDNIFYLFSEGKLHDFFLDNDDGMHEGSGFWPSGDGYGPWFSGDGSGFMPSGDGFPTDITTLPGFWSNGSYTHFEYENGLVEIHGQTNGSRFKVTWNNGTHSFYTARDGLHFFNGESNGTHNFYTESDGQQIWYGFDDGHNFMYGGSNRTHIWGGGKNDTHSFMYIGPGEMQGKERDGSEPNWQTNEDGMKHFQANGAHITWFFDEAVNAETRILWEHIDNMIAHEGSGSPGDNIFYLFSEGKLHDFFLDNDDGMHEGSGFWPSGDGYGPWFSGDGSGVMPSGDGFPTDITTLPGFWSNGSYTHFEYENGLVEIHGQTNGSQFKVTWNNGTHSFYTARDGLHFFNGESNGTHNFYTESDGQQIWYGFDDGHNFMYGGSNRTHIWGGGKNDTHSFMYIGPGEMQGKERDGLEPNWQTNEDGMKHFQANGAHITWFFDEAVNAETRTLWEHIDNMIAHEGSGSPGDNIFYLFSEGKLHDFFLDNDDGMHEGSGFWPSGDGYGPWFSGDGSSFMPSGDGFPTDITTLPGFWSNGSYTHFEYENGLVEIHGQTNGSRFKVTWNNGTHSFYTARDGLHFFNGESNGTHNFYTESDGQQIWYGFDDGHNFMYGGSNRTHIWGGGKNDTHSFMYIGPGEMQGKERDGSEPNWQTNEDGMKHFQANGAHITWFFDEAVNAETRTLWEHIDNMIAHEGSGSPGDNIFYLFSEGKLHDFFLDNDDGMHEGSGFWPSGDGYGPWFSGDGSGFMTSGDGSGFMPSGDGSGFMPSGDGYGPWFSGDGSGFMPSGDGSGFMPSGDSSGFMPSGDGYDPWFSGDGSGFMPSGDGSGFMPSGDGSGLMPSGDGYGPWFSGDGSGFMPSGDGSGFMPSGDGYGPWFSGDGSGFMPSGDGFPTDITTLPGFWSNSSYTHFEYENGLVEIHGQTNGSRFKVTWNNGTHSFYTARDGLHFFNGESNGTHNFYTESDGQQIWYGFDDGHNFMYGGSNRTHIWGGGKNDTHSFMYIGQGEMQGKERDGSEPNWQTNEDGMKHFQANGAHITWFFDEAVNAETRTLWEHIDNMIAHEGSGSPGDNIFYLFSEGKLHDFFLDNDDGMHEGSGFWPSGDGYGPWFSGDGSGFMPSGDGSGFMPSGDGSGFMPSGDGSGFMPSGDGSGFMPSGDGSGFMPSGDGSGFMPSGDGSGFMPSGDGSGFMPSGDGSGFIPSGDGSGFMPSGDGSGFMPSGDGSGFMPSGDGSGFMPSGDGSGFMPSGDGSGFMPSGDGSGFMPSGDGSGFMPSGDGSGFMPSGDGSGFMPSGDGSGFMPSGDGSGDQASFDLTTLPEYWTNDSLTTFKYSGGTVEILGQLNSTTFKITWHNITHSLYAARNDTIYYNGESNGTHSFYTETNGNQLRYGFNDGQNFYYGGSNRTHIFAGGYNLSHAFYFDGNGNIPSHIKSKSEEAWTEDNKGTHIFKDNGQSPVWFRDNDVSAEVQDYWDHVDMERQQQLPMSNILQGQMFYVFTDGRLHQIFVEERRIAEYNAMIKAEEAQRTKKQQDTACVRAFNKTMVDLQEEKDICEFISIPRCKLNGEYSRTQCQDNIGKCWCVTENNQEIQNTRTRGNPQCDRATKPGNCPSFQLSSLAADLTCDESMNACETDDDCSDDTNSKCCFNGCHTVCTAPQDGDAGVCPNAQEPKCCSFLMCVKSACPAHPKAACRVDPCGGCSVKYFDDLNNEVDCYEGLSDCEKDQYEVETVLSYSAYDTLMEASLNSSDKEGEKKWEDDARAKYQQQQNNSRKKRATSSGQKMYRKSSNITEVDICSLPVNVGNCRKSEERFYYDPVKKDCVSFSYKGCGGNANNFLTKKECYLECGLEEIDPCQTQTCEAGKWCVALDKNTAVCESNSLVTKKSQPTPPFCAEDGSYNPIQCDVNNDLCWCVNSDGSFVAGTMVKGTPACTNADVQSGESAVCADGSEPKACKDACKTATCDDSRTDIMCVVDRCNNCAESFVDTEGNTVRCNADICAITNPPTITTANRRCLNSVKRYYFDSSKCNSFDYNAVCSDETDFFFETLESCQMECMGGIQCTTGTTNQICEDTCETAECPPMAKAKCKVDPCTCEAKFYDPMTGDIADCSASASLPSACEQRRSKIIYTNKEKKSRGQSEDNVPECEADGNFSPKQCNTAGTSCWCVNAAGNQVSSVAVSGSCTEKKIVEAKSSIKIERDFSEVRDNLEEFKQDVLETLRKMSQALVDAIASIVIREGSIVVDITFDNSTSSDPAANSMALEGIVDQGLTINSTLGNFTAASISVTYDDGTVTQDKTSDDESSSNTGIIVGVVVGVVVAVGVVAAVAFYMLKFKGGKKSRAPSLTSIRVRPISPMDSMAHPPPVFLTKFKLSPQFDYDELDDDLFLMRPVPPVEEKVRL